MYLFIYECYCGKTRDITMYAAILHDEASVSIAK